MKHLQHPSFKTFLFLAAIHTLAWSTTVHAKSVTKTVTPSVAPTPAHGDFFNSIKKLCGKAFEGKVTVNTPPSEGFEGRLLMHVRKCTDTEIQIPFHVGENRSRTWILTQTASGLSLKHDHRKTDGTHDASTMYGGHTVNKGSPLEQSFPADQYSKELFIKQGIPQSTKNTWKMSIHPKVFTYSLTREGREFLVTFDLTKPVTPLPPAPWGH